MISKEQKPSFSESQNVNQDGENGNSVISSELYLKSSTDHQNLDKNVVLRRLRFHKVRAKLQGLLDTRNYDYYEHKWLEQGDVFCSP